MTKTAADREHWARVARDWTAWARKPGHDAFWAYRDALVGYIGRGSGPPTARMAFRTATTSAPIG